MLKMLRQGSIKEKHFKVKYKYISEGAVKGVTEKEYPQKDFEYQVVDKLVSLIKQLKGKEAIGDEVLVSLGLPKGIEVKKVTLTYTDETKEVTKYKLY